MPSPAPRYAATTDSTALSMERTFAALHKARIALWLIDALPTEKELQEIIELTKDKSLIITQNKIDKDKALDIPLSTFCNLHNYSFLQISAKQGTNLQQLEQAIYDAADIPTLTDTDVIITNARHYDALVRARHSLSRVLDGLHTGLSGDLLSEDLRDVLNILSEITGGQITTPEVLGNIFKNFCVGK